MANAGKLGVALDVVLTRTVGVIVGEAVRVNEGVRVSLWITLGYGVTVGREVGYRENEVGGGGSKAGKPLRDSHQPPTAIMQNNKAATPARLQAHTKRFRFCFVGFSGAAGVEETPVAEV